MTWEARVTEATNAQIVQTVGNGKAFHRLRKANQSVPLPATLPVLTVSLHNAQTDGERQVLSSAKAALTRNGHEFTALKDHLKARRGSEQNLHQLAGYIAWLVLRNGFTPFVKAKAAPAEAAPAPTPGAAVSTADETDEADDMARIQAAMREAAADWAVEEW